MRRSRIACALVILGGLLAAGGENCVTAGSAKSNEFDANGVKIHFLVEGQGPPVVLIHGLYSSAEINWKLTGVVKDLAKDHQVIPFDMPGHGRSDRPENDDAYGTR